MRKSYKKLYVAVCGNLSSVMERLARRRDVECFAVPNGRELREQLMDIDNDAVELALVESGPGEGLFPLYFPTAEAECPVFLIGDSPGDAVMDALMNEIDHLLLEKRRQMSPIPHPQKKDTSTVYKLKKGVEVIEQDGTPGLRLGEKEQYAKTPLQAWLIELLSKKSWTVDELEKKMAEEKASEVEKFLAEQWTTPEDIDGWEVLEWIKKIYTDNGDNAALQVPGLALFAFHEDFGPFLR